MKDKLVGRLMAFDMEEIVQKKWLEKNSYLSLLRDCADCGNLDAHFILGADELHNARRAISGPQLLQLAMDGVVLLHQAATWSDAMEILNRVYSRDLSNAAADQVTECTISGNPITDRRRECWMYI